MMASMPIRRDEVSQRKVPEPEWVVQLAPSRAAAAAGHVDTVYYLRNRGLPPVQGVIDRSRLFNPIKRRTGEILNFTQFDYLNLIDDLIKLIIQLNGRVHIRFLHAIQRAQNALRADRRRIAASYHGRSHATRWASNWPLKLPDYDPTICSHVSGKWLGRKKTFGKT